MFLWSFPITTREQKNCDRVLHPFAGFVSCVNQHHLLVNYLHDVKDILQVYELSTGQLIRDLPLGVGTVSGVSCRKKHSDFFYKFTSFTTPGNSVVFMGSNKVFSVSGGLKREVKQSPPKELLGREISLQS